MVYNHGKYLRKTLDGFVMQETNFQIEVLIHDDASTDDSADIIREYSKRYPDIIKPIIQYALSKALSAAGIVCEVLDYSLEYFYKKCTMFFHQIIHSKTISV